MAGLQIGVSDEFKEFLRPTRFIDSDDPGVMAFAHEAVGEGDEIERGVNLYYAVRDSVDYDPYYVGEEADYYRAGACLAQGRGFCIPKAALLTACARAVGIASRVGYADVYNHLSTPRLEELVGGNVYRWHSYSELFLDGHWVKATPVFDDALCERLGVHALDFDGHEDSLFQEFNRVGDRHMEYLTDRGTFSDVPWQAIVADFRRYHPLWLDNRKEVTALA